MDFGQQVPNGDATGQRDKEVDSHVATLGSASRTVDSWDLEEWLVSSYWPGSVKRSRALLSDGYPTRGR
jgi:hypothetical protein